MTSKYENQYIKKLGNRMPENVYQEKTHNPFRSGIPDMYYETSYGMLWVEYKWIPKLPVRDTTVIKPKLEPLQLDWLSRAYQNGMPVAVVIGIGKGVNSQGIIMEEPQAWYRGRAKQFCAIYPNHRMADEIVSRIRRLR